MVPGNLPTVGKLAEELGVPVGELLVACQDHGISVFSERSPITGLEADRLRRLFAQEPAERPKLPAPRLPRARGSALAIALAIALVVAVGAFLVLRDDGDPDFAVGPPPTTAPRVSTTTSTTERPTTTSTTSTTMPPAPTDAHPQAGQCWDQQFVVVVQPCDVPHQAEAYAVVPHAAPPGEPYPGDPAMVRFAYDECAFRFQSFVGQFLPASSLDLRLLLPEPERWAEGERGVVCSVVTRDGSSLVGSVAQSGR